MKYRKLTWRNWNISIYPIVLLDWGFGINLSSSCFCGNPVFRISIWKYGIGIWREGND